MGGYGLVENCGERGPRSIKCSGAAPSAAAGSAVTTAWISCNHLVI